MSYDPQYALANAISFSFFRFLFKLKGKLMEVIKYVLFFFITFREAGEGDRIKTGELR